MDTERIRQAVRELLAAIGEDPNRDELADTPDKVSESYQEFFKGIGVDPVDYLQESFPADSTELVMLKDIELVSICEHHLLPFTGVAHVAFLPDKKSLVWEELPKWLRFWPPDLNCKKILVTK